MPADARGGPSLLAMSPLDQEWAQSVCDYCDPIFEAANVGFTRQISYADDGVVDTLLWEADPARFADTYPDSGIVESYGEDRWPQVHCIDFWVYVEHENRQCRLSMEGWNLPDLVLPFTGNRTLDACGIADTFARVLGVQSPRATSEVD
jgi:hypothetical protein